MHNIGVDRYGIDIMRPKAVFRVVYLSGISSFSANIVKQEILSLGGDLALPKEALFKKKLIDCVLIATEAQIGKLIKKLKIQPYFLIQIGSLIKESLADFSREKFVIDTPRYTLNINKPLVMGILNITPDSFSGDGLLGHKVNPRLRSGQARSSRKSSRKISSRGRSRRGRQSHKDLILQRVEQMVKEGADLIDVGGESTRPGTKPVSSREELRRVMPAIKIITKRYPGIPVSIDTYKPEVARCAIDEGACIVNDITALKSQEMAKLLARRKVGVVLMHMKGKPQTMQRNPFYKDVLGEIYGFLNGAIKKALYFGIDKKRVIIDVGIGFGKRLEDNLKLIKYLYEFRTLGRPILIGVSRKSFIGKVLKKDNPQERLAGTLASLVVSIMNGAKILRVHDIGQAKESVKLADAILSQ